jgi:RNA polymerase sigma factor (sigma-70 family)
MTKPFLAPVLHDLRRLAETTEDRQQSDRQLLERYLSRRDEAAFTALVRRHGRLVLAACRRVLADEADVEDAFQATFLVLMRRAALVPWHESIGCWLFGVAHRIAVRALASAARRRGLEVQASRQRARPEQAPANLSWRETVGLLHEELDRLPDAFRMPILLCCLDGKTRDEVAQALGCSVGAIKGRLERGREMLLRRLTRRGLALSGTLLAALVEAPKGTTAPPSSLIQSTLTAARTGQYSRFIAALMQTATSSIFSTKMRIAAGLLLTVSLLVVGGGRAFTPGGANPATQPKGQDSPPNRAPEETSASVTLRGQVLNPDGKPVAGARLYFPRPVKERRPGEADVELVQRGITDGKGRFHLQLPGKEIQDGRRGNPLIAAADGFGVAWVELPARDAPGELTLRLVKDVPIRGRLVSTEGKPVAGVTVRVAGLLAFQRLDDFLRVFQRESRHWDEGTGTRRLQVPLTSVLNVKPTDKDGRFEIRGIGVERVVGLQVTSAAVAEGPMMVVTREGFDARAFEKNRLGGRGERVPLFGPSFEHVVERAEAGRAIEGTVRESGSGKAVAGATVAAATASVVTDAHGHYRLAARHKAPEYFLYVSAPEKGSLIGRRLRVQAPPAAGQEPIRADVELIRGVVITGRIHDKATGKGKAGCSILYVALPENKTARMEDLFLHTTSGDDGRFRLVTIAGPGMLLASAPGSFKIDGVPIDCYKPAELSAADRRRVKKAPVDLDLFKACKVVDVPDRGGTLKCDLALDPGKTLAVHLQDPDGKPLAGTLASGITFWTKRAIPLQTDRCRVYTLDPDKPRSVAFVHLESKLAAVVTLSGKEKEPVTVRLKPAGSITGRALDGDGQPHAGAEIYLVYATELGRPFTESQGRSPMPRTDKEGRFRIEAVVPGIAVRTLGFLEGRQMLVPQARLQIKPLESGQTLDVGDIRTRPRKP